MPNPTIVSAALNDEELRKSITKLVSDYKDSLNDMKTYTTQIVGDIKEAIKSIGETKVDFSGTFEGMEKAKKKMAGAASGGSTSTKVTYPDNTIGALEESIRLERERRREMKLNSDELRKQNQIIHEQQNQLKDETKSIATKRLENALKMPSNDIDEANKKLRVLDILQRRYGDTTELSVTEQKKLAGAIGQTQKAINTLNSKRPRSIKEVLGMDASSIDAIQQKLKAISNLRMNINADAHPRVIAMLNQQYDELHKKQLRLMGQNGELVRSNRALASTFGYIRNRIIYAFTLGTLTQFFNDVRNIRAEYEMLDRSLGILVGDFEKGTQIFNELNQMALQSPFTLIELGTAAKQLTAYNFAADEVVDTTRRLADISAALGVPMERLTYNLGQIKAQGALTARDARDFANAGLAIVPMLADMYTKQKAFGKEMTTTADVYDMMSKKMVSYGDVLSVLQKVTNEGGKFFNFQARQADTLKVQIANLSLAYNNMMNEIGADNQGLLTGSIRMVRSLFVNWKTVANVIQQLIITFGAYKAAAIVVTALNSRMFVGGALVGLRNYIRGIKAATGAMATFNAVTKLNPIGFLAAALASVAGYFLLFRDNVQEVSQEVEMFGESASKTLKKIDTLKKILDGTSDTSSTYKKTLSELSGVMHEYGIELDAEKANRDEINNATEQTIQLIKEEAAERQRANNIAKGEENYNKGIKDAKDAFYSEISDISDLTDIGGQTKKFREELENNAQAISDVVATIVEDNISLVVGKSGDEATKGMLEIQEKVSGAMSSMGISSKATQYLLYNTDILRDLIVQTRKVSEEQLNYNNKIDSYYDAAKKATESTITFTQKVEANSRALQNTSNDALSLYNKIYDIVKIAQQNHTINFDIKLTADNPPKWMLDKSLPELQRLAQRFAAVAQSGGHIEGYDREGTYQQALRYASAARQKQETEERAARMKDNNKTKKERDAILDTIKEEISLTKKLQGEYDKLTSKGASHADAIKDVENRYASTIKLLNVDLGKFSLPKFDTDIITGKDPNKQLEYFKKLRNLLESKGLLNLERSKVLDATIQELDVSAKTFNLDKITKGLNSELDRLKEEYELAVSLDADPELGSMFADWMGIDMSDLPRTAQEYADRYTSYLNKYLKDKKSNIELPSLLNITNDDLREFQEKVAEGGMSQEWVDEITKGVKAVRDVFSKEKENTSKEWNALIEKYGGLQAKILKIYKDNVQQQASIVREFGTNDEQIKALDLIGKIKISQDPAEIARLQEELAKVMSNVTSRNPIALKTYQATQKEQSSLTSKAMWEDFKDSDLYSMTFTDMANNSTQAIQMIIDKLNTLKDKVKEDPASMKALIKSLEDAEGELMSRDPFAGISNSISTWIKATKEQKDAQEELKQANVEVAGSEIALKNAQSVGDKEAIVKAEQKLAQAQQKQVVAQGKVVQSGNKAKKAQEQLKTSFQNLSNELGNVSGLLGSVSQIFRAVGDDDTADAIDAINEGFSIMTTVIMGVNAALLVLESSNPWLLAMAAALSVIVGLVKFLSSNSNEKITEQVEESERAVRRLELAYKELEYAINNAYGTGILGAQKLAIENKKAQLEELRRQLSLEQSRSGKDRDEDKILDLKEKIVDLEHEITDSTNELVNSLLGVSSIGDAAENMMGAYIDALRDGEDAMKAFNESIDDMIANMVIKMLTTKIIQPWFERQWDVIQNDLTSRGAELAKEIEAEQLKLANARPTDMTNEDSLVAALRDLGYSDDSIFNLMWEQGAGTWIKRGDSLERLREEYNKSFSESGRKLNELQRVYDDATSVTLDDIIRYAELLRSGQPVMDENMKAIQGLLGELGIMNNDTENNLSALQQGIQGVTEETAGAVEAYLNGVSQQVYLHSELLTQIRDAIIGSDSDIGLGVQAQMLLQLQQSFLTQQAIQSILEGWSSPDGMSVRVQLES